MSLKFFDTILNSWEKVTGKDGRENTSSRVASRLYYLSRDKGSVYSWSVDYPASEDDEFVFYFKNTSETESFFIENFHLESDVDCDFQVCWVDGVAVGVDITGTSWNKQKDHTVSAEVKNSGVTGLTGAGGIIRYDVKAGITSIENVGGVLVINKDEAIAIKVSKAAKVHIALLGAFE